MICYLNPAVAEDVDAGKSRSLPRLDVSGFDSRLGASVVRVAARVRGRIRRGHVRRNQNLADRGRLIPRRLDSDNSQVLASSPKRDREQPPIS